MAQSSFEKLARTLTPEEWSVRLPCTPDWTARDVLSHVSGIPDDALAGRMEGAPGEAWTASQVERNAAFSVDELLERWKGQAQGFADVIEAGGEVRPPVDCHIHEHDVRQAIGRPGNRDSVIVTAAAAELARLHATPVPLRVVFDDGTVVESGPTDGRDRVVLRDVTAFEVFRSRPGRRSRQQVRAWDWTGDDDAIESVLDHWFFFGPSPLPIEE
jgi:uncharacterized protein (TIGR03083 family)